MPRITAASNSAQRAETQRRILTAFGELLFTHGLPGLTMTDVARHARIGRTAVYNYYADIEELLIAYALDETERFLLQDILRDGMAQGYFPETDITHLAQLIHGTLSSSAARGDGAGADPEAEARIARTVRFVQLGAGARFDDAGRPLRLAA